MREGQDSSSAVASIRSRFESATCACTLQDGLQIGVEIRASDHSRPQPLPTFQKPTERFDGSLVRCGIQRAYLSPCRSNHDRAELC